MYRHNRDVIHKVLLKCKCFTVPGCSSWVGDAAVGESEAPQVTARHAPYRSNRVLTDEVLQIQKDTIGAIKEVTKELQDIKTVLSQINDTLVDEH